jgi:RHS repeat-associated protein
MKRLPYAAIIALGISASAFAQQKPVTLAYGNLPMNFEQNVGQTDSQAQFISHGKGYTLFLSPNQAIFKFHAVSFPVMDKSDERRLGKRLFVERSMRATRKTAIVRMKLLAANPGAQLVGVDKMSGTASYFIGRDPSKWRTGVALFAKVQSSEVFPGIDLIYYGNEKRLEYDFVVKPGADPNSISLGFEGIQSTSIDSSGNLSMATEIGGMNLNKPVVYQMIGGQRKEIDGKYGRRGANAVGFNVTGYDKTQPLIIDPVLTYSTLLGGSGNDGIYDIAVDSSGNSYVAGWTDSTDFPIVGTSLTPAPSGTQVAFVAKFNSTGTGLVYSTYLGGNGGEWGSGIALDANGSAYIVGQTGSSNFPVTSNAYQESIGSGASQNAFVSKLSADGQSLLYSTYLGGGGYDMGIGIALDGSQNAYVTGYTTSGSPSPFPTTANAFQFTLNSVYGNGFISRIDTTKSGSSSLVYSTFLGGSGNWDQTNGIVVDANQNVYVGGMTSSSDFPLTPTAYQSVVDTYNGTAFLTQIDTTKSGSAGLIYSTVLEGETYAAGVALDGNGKVYTTGGYVAKFDTTKSGSASLLYFTRVGGSSDSFTYSVSVDPNGDSYVAGWTWSTDLTVTPDAIQSTLGSGGQNAFITALRPDGSAVLFGSYLGGNGGTNDFASSVAVDQNYNIYVAGATQSSNFQTTSSAFQTSLDGTTDAFVMKFSPLNVPIITSISPATGIIGATVTINGKNFGSSQGNSTVAFANGATAQVTNWTATSITTTVPSGATSGNVVVTVSGVSSNEMYFTVSASWSNGYLQKRAITINHTEVPNTDQTNFPVLISGTYPFLATTMNGGQATNASGYDIIFTADAGGTIPLPFERESYNASTGSVTFWVQVPTVSHTTDTQIYMFYGNSSITTDQSNKPAVWDSNYQGVWHLEETSGQQNDSTSNGNNSTGVAVTAEGSAAGQIGGADQFNASNPDHVDLPNIALTSAFTLQAWIYPTQYTDYARVLNKAFSSNSSPYLTYGLLFETAASKQIGLAFDHAGSGVGLVSTETISLNQWTHVVGTYDGTSLKLFINGTLDSSAAASGSIDAVSTPTEIGYNSAYTVQSFTGNIDEVRISSIARSADWIATEYNNQNSPSTFYSMGAGDWSNGYAYQSAITIPHSHVPNTDQTNFPVLISGTYPNLATTANGGNVTNANGYDIVFSLDPSGTNPLAYERESYNSATGAIIFWVKVPTLSHTTDTVIYMSYGNPSITTDQSNKTAVWDSNFEGVWHLPNGTILTGNDSTDNGNNATVYGTPAATAGQIDGAATFGASTANYLQADDAASLRIANAITLSAWIYNTADNLNGGGLIVEKRDPTTPGNNYNYGLWLAPGGQLLFQFNDGSYRSSTTSTGAVPKNVWTHVVASVDESTQLVSFYVNGSLYSTTTKSGSMPSSGTGVLQIGNYGTFNGGVYSFEGIIDEVRTSNKVRSGDWIATEYNNQNSPAAFYGVGASTTAPHLTNLSPSSGSAGTLVTITGTNFGSTQGSSTVAFNGVTTTPIGWSNTQIVAPVPAGTLTGNVVVNVSNLNSNGLGFTDNSAGISSISPVLGIVGTSVTIVGTGFGPTQGSSTVTFNGTLASPISWSNTQIAVPVPNGASSGYVVVTASGATSDGDYFTVVLPTISALSPSSGPTGTSVTIRGSYFGATQGSGTVTFNGTAATPTSWSSTSIVAPVPAAANTGNVVVTAGVVSGNGVGFSVVPNIASLSPASGLAGTPITIIGTGFGPTQGTSTVTFNGTQATPISWSNTSILVPVPSDATNGNLVVTVSGFSSAGAYFPILPSGWVDLDVGSVGIAGSATYSNGTFTIEGAGTDINGTADGMHFVYQPLSGDGTIVARVFNLQGSYYYPKAGVMIRETLSPSSTHAYIFEQQPAGIIYYFEYRPTTGGSTVQPSEFYGSSPYWVKVTRSGSVFSGYLSFDGVNWVQVGSSQTINMATNVYFGLAVTNDTTNSLATGTFDHVSITSAGNPAPVITSLSATTGPVGSQVVITGTGFGSSQNGSSVVLDGSPATISSWSSSSITITVPTGATTGYLTVCLAPSLNNSNPVIFEVTTQPLPSGWLDQDVGPVGVFGSATYSTSSGTFAVTGGGTQVGGTGDQVHFVYQPLSGDGTIVARLLSVQNGGDYERAGLMIRETLASGATMAFMGYQYANGGPTQFTYRITPDGSSSQDGGFGVTPPYWFMLVRSGNTFTGYEATDGVNWTFVGSTQISMATNVYVGLVDSAYSTGLVTATFDNVSINSAATPAPVITSVSATTGSIGSQVIISGTGFGSQQGGSVVLLNDLQATVTFWSDTSIAITIPTGATSGYLTVCVAPAYNNSNPVPFEVTTQPLPSGWLDQDIGLVGLPGNTTYTGSTGTFTVNAAGGQPFFGFTPDTIHFVYQPLSGDGTIVARLDSLQNGAPYRTAGVMIRETLASGATMAFAGYTYGNGLPEFAYRATTNGSAANVSGAGIGLPYWFMLIRSGNTFKAYTAPDGVNWTQLGTTQTIAMATNVYVGLAVTSTNSAALTTATFDNVAIGNTAAFISPVLTSITPPAAPAGGTVILNGTDFGSSQNSSVVSLNGVPANISSWSSTSITITVPNNATSGPATVTVAGVTSNPVQFTVIEAATVTGLSPTAGPTGSSVVITGTGFGPTQSDSTVSFYAATATTNIISWSDTSITATVPVGTVTGPLTVTVAGITVTGPVFTLTLSATLTDSFGNTTTYASAILGGQYVPTISQGSGCSTCSVRGNSTNTFDSRGNVLATTDPAGHVVTNTYDSSNNLLSQAVQLNSTTVATTSNTYNSFGEVLTVTDPLGNVTTDVYDAHGNLTSVTSPAPNSSTAASLTAFAYNSLGELTSITDPLSHVTTMTYTTAGLIATITDPQNNVTTYAYDAKGNRTSVTDALSHQTTFAYDAMSRLTTITYPDATTSTFAYDSRGRRTSVTDQNGKTTAYAYDDADRLTSVTDAASHVTYYAYDTEDNLTSITDASSNQTAFTYDAFGRVTQTNFPSSLSENYQYDADNNLTQKTDRKGQTITYLYDALNRLTSKTYPDTTAVDYVYDLVGKIQQVNDPTGTYAFAYDNMGRLIGTTTSYSFLTSRNFTNAYAYDAASNRTGFTDPESGATAYSYDALNRLTSLAPPSAFGSGSFGFTYDALSRRTQMTRPNSVTTNYTYDNLSRLTSVLHQLSGSTIDGASYTLDAGGNRTAKTDQLASSTANYTYDAIYQLTQVTQANNTTESYNYDAVGNRTASLGVSSYTTNASNELTATSNASYTYDSNGNTLTKTVGSNTTSYTWDFENRLTSVTLPGSGGTVTFKYDPLGQRIYKSSSAGTSVYAYSDYDLIEETNSSGTAVARYAQGARVDEPFAMLRSSATSYYNADGLGTVTSLANGSGSLTQTYNYDSFGKMTASSGSLVNSLQYTGREFDSETGLYYYRARYYDSATGKFISEDPISFKGEIDFYAYAGNSPTNLTDPSGLCPPGTSGCPSPNPNNPQPMSKCSTYTDRVHRFACRELAGDDPVGMCVRGCLLAQYDPSKGKYNCNEADLHCACFDACGFTGLKARAARTFGFACDYRPTPFKWGAGMR